MPVKKRPSKSVIKNNISNKLVLKTEVVEAHSYSGYADCFEQLAKYAAKDKDMLISHIKANHSAEGWYVKLFLILDVIEPKITKKNKSAVSTSVCFL